jgi:hypothetical protein
MSKLISKVSAAVFIHLTSPRAFQAFQAQHYSDEQATVSDLLRLTLTWAFMNSKCCCVHWGLWLLVLSSRFQRPFLAAFCAAGITVTKVNSRQALCSVLELVHLTFTVRL